MKPDPPRPVGERTTLMVIDDPSWFDDTTEEERMSA